MMAFDRKSILKKYRAKPIYRLPFSLVKAENMIYKLIVNGDSLGTSKKLCRYKYKRNVIREVMLEKLLEWKEEKGKDELTYSKALELGKGLINKRTELGFLDEGEEKT